MTTNGADGARRPRVNRARHLFLAGPRLSLQRTRELMSAMRSSVAKSSSISGDSPTSCPNDPIVLLRRAGDRLFVDVEPEGGRAHGDLGPRCEFDLDHPVRTDPGAVGAPRVADVHALADAAKLEVDAADARIVEHEVVGRMPSHRGQRAGHGEPAARAGAVRRREPRNARDRGCVHLVRLGAAAGGGGGHVGEFYQLCIGVAAPYARRRKC